MDLFINQEVDYNNETFIISAFCNDKKELSMKYDDLDFCWVLLYSKISNSQIIANCNLIQPIIETYNKDEFEEIIDSII